MSITLAKKSGFCYGVKRAVDICLNIKKDYPNQTIYTLGPLIHNNDVVSFLKSKNIFPIDYENIDTLKEGNIIVLRSHGVTLETINKLKTIIFPSFSVSIFFIVYRENVFAF